MTGKFYSTLGAVLIIILVTLIMWELPTPQTTVKKIIVTQYSCLDEWTDVNTLTRVNTTELQFREATHPKFTGIIIAKVLNVEPARDNDNAMVLIRPIKAKEEGEYWQAYYQMIWTVNRVEGIKFNKGQVIEIFGSIYGIDDKFALPWELAVLRDVKGWQTTLKRSCN